ncbi:MAG TPA: hypothetical protein VIJ91_10455 [Candidatus Dormibacteraeota bacterium]
MHVGLNGIVNAEQLHENITFGKSVSNSDTLPVGRDHRGRHRAPTGTRFDRL